MKNSKFAGLLLAASIIIAGCEIDENAVLGADYSDEYVWESKFYIGTTGDRDIDVEKNVFKVGEEISFVFDNGNKYIGHRDVKIYYYGLPEEYENAEDLIYTIEDLNLDPIHVWFHQRMGPAEYPGKYRLRAYIGEELFGEIDFEIVE